MLEIISHRGYWLITEEKNQPLAFHRSFSLTFGTETDFRDYNTNLVISHDIATATSLQASEFLDIYKRQKCTGTLALNIKADGLQKKLKALLEEYEIKNYFVFDMSIPDTIGYLNEGIDFYTRQSEHEPVPSFYDKCSGIWLDAFEGIWYKPELILEHIANGKKVAIVSPELHKRAHLGLWQMLKDSYLHTRSEVLLCTDIPEEASNFFKV